MFIKDILALPEWFLFVELFVYAGIIVVGIIPTSIRLVRRRRQHARLAEIQNMIFTRAQKKAEEIKKEISRQYLDPNEKRRQTVKEKYGVDYAFQYNANEKRRQTMIKKYGVEYAFQLKNEN